MLKITTQFNNQLIASIWTAIARLESVLDMGGICVLDRDDAHEPKTYSTIT